MTNQAFTWAAAQATGNAHIAEALPLQDAKAFRVIQGADGNTWIAAAVADGAGSAPLAEKGARAASAAFVGALAHDLKYIQKPDLPSIVFNAVATARTVVERLAHARNVPIEHLSTTLLGCLTRGDETLVVQIGDGAIVVGPPWLVALTPQRGEYANTTRFLTEPDWRDHIEIGHIATPIGTIVLVTDGLEELVVTPARQEPHGAFFERLRTELSQVEHHGEATAISAWLKGFLDSPAVRSRTHDDTSIIAIQLQGEENVDSHP